MNQAMSLTLLDYLAQVPDPRRRQGQRFTHPQMLLMVLMSYLSGRYAYREVAAFAAANQPDLRAYLHLKWPRTPSHVSFRSYLQALDFARLGQAFTQWMQAQGVPPSLPTQPEWVALDGKALRATIQHYNTAQQDFLSVVSAFATTSGVVLDQQPFHNARQSEGPVVVELIARLRLQGAVLSLDALHCQKNTGRRPAQRQRLSGQGQGQSETPAQVPANQLDPQPAPG